MVVYVEYAAVLSGLLYVLLAARHNVWCWPSGIVSSVCYTYVNWHHGFYQDMLLQIYYVGAGFYGWHYWQQREARMVIGRLTEKQFLLYLLSGGIVAPVFGYLFSKLGNSYSYLDSIVTVFSLLATWLTARSILQNWIFWMGVNAVAVVMYGLKGLQPTVGLYVVYFVMSGYGFYEWQKKEGR